MALNLKPWNIQDHIVSPDRQVGYLEAAFEDGDPALITAALGDIAKARGMSAVAVEAGITREGLYKALSTNGDPRLSTLVGVLKALGIRLRPEVETEVREPANVKVSNHMDATFTMLAPKKAGQMRIRGAQARVDEAPMSAVTRVAASRPYRDASVATASSSTKKKIAASKTKAVRPAR